MLPDEYYTDNTSSVLSCWDIPVAVPNFHFATVIILLLINVVVISANLIVICILFLNKQLRSSNSNLFILSLAISDLTLGLFVLPLSTVTQTLDIWVFGAVLCRIWLALDVWLCTASIYNLVVITIDRFIAVTRPLAYKALITTKKVLYMIIAAWVSSFCLCIPVIFLNRPELAQCRCTHMTNSRSYILSSSTISFYIPFMVILYFYFRIYTKVRRVTSAASQGFIKLNDACNNSSDVLSLVQQHPACGKIKSAEETPLVSSRDSIITASDGLRIHKGGYCSGDKLSALRNQKQPNSASTDELGNPPLGCNRLSISSPIVRPRSQTWQGNGTAMRIIGAKFEHKSSRKVFVPSQNGSLNAPSHLQARSASAVLMKRPEFFSLTKYQKRLSAEIKTLKTVGIVTGCFLLSWIGFCIIYTLESLELYQFPETIISVFMWLGYVNSAINPFIYAGYNRQYRQSLKKLLKCGSELPDLVYESPSMFSGAINNISGRKPS